MDLVAAHEQQLAALLGEGALLAERQRAFRQLALAPLCAGQFGARRGDSAFGRSHLRGECLRLAARRRERLGALVVPRLRGNQRLAGLPQLGLVPGLEGGAELGVELAVAARALRLPLQLPQAWSELADHHPHVAEVVARLRQPPLGLRELNAVAVNLGGLLDQVAPLERTQAEHLVDEALRHHRVGVLADLGAPEEIVHVQQPHLLAVDAVLVLTTAVGAPADAHLVEVDRHPVLGVVEDQRHLGDAHLAPFVGAGEDHVAGLAGADRARRLLAEGPADGVGDVGLAGAVGSDDRGQAGAELEDLAVREGLEPVRFDSPQVHPG